MSYSNEQLKEFTIDRSKWACASNNAVRGAGSLLEDGDGFKCCLGFYASACGLPTGRMLQEEKMPEPKFAGFGVLDSIPVYERTPAFNTAILHRSSKLIGVNDNILNDQEREEKVAKLFTENGIKVNFIGEYLTVIP